MLSQRLRGPTRLVVTLTRADVVDLQLSLLERPQAFQPVVPNGSSLQPLLRLQGA